MNGSTKTGMDAYFAGLLSRSERLSYYAMSRGWGFVMTSAHRIAGALLVLYMFFHIITLSGLHDPAGFASKMAFVDNFFFGFLEWMLAVPLIFHGLNGTRLILYELFGVREDAVLIRWVFVLSGIYVLTLGVFMVLGNQHVSAGFFWLTTAIAGTLAGVVVSGKIGRTRNRGLWKLQRISGAFLLPMAAGHMVFMHLNFQAGHDVETILARMSGMGIKTLDFVFVVTVFFHAGFGVTTIIGDLVEDKRLRFGLCAVASLIMAAFAYAGIKLVCTI